MLSFSTGKQTDGSPADDRSAGYRIERVVHNETGQLVVHVAGRNRPFVDARVVQCFPWSLPNSYISVRERDGKEITLLKDLGQFDPADRRVIEEELRQKVFNPRIKRVIDCRSEFSVISITAETDRGEVTFQVRSRDDIRLLSPVHVLIQDADGTIYEIPDLNALRRDDRARLKEYL